jgi:DeoR family suf operon transcriptional repressor
MQNSRQKILSYIAQQQVATADELSHVFHVTPSNIRHHLSILMDQGSIEVLGQKVPSGKGRPTQIYSCVEAGNKNSLEPLTESLLAYLLLSEPTNEIDHPLKKIAGMIVSHYQIDVKNPTQRLYSTMKVLNKMGYHAHWEAHGSSPRIMFDRCPYRSLVDRHPDICQLDKYILEKLLATSVDQVEKKTINIKGLPQCLFIVNRLI